MQLPLGRRTVIGSFEQAQDASRAAEALRRAGFEGVQVDRVSQYPGDVPDHPFQPLSGRVESLATLTMGVRSLDPDTGAALAAHPSASGLAAGPSARLTAYIVTAVVPEARAGEAVRIMKRHGAVV
ncbi:MAG: hypothetical protein AB1609_01965 [Bacillota bacterium]